MSPFKRSAILSYTTVAILAALLIAGTFPKVDWSFGPGDDPPLAWVFNSLFQQGIETAKDFIFPHGPLAFFLYPLPENGVLVMAVIALLKLSLFLSLIRLPKLGSFWSKRLLAFALAYLISALASFELLLLSNVLVLLQLGLRDRDTRYVYIAALCTAFAFYVKAYVGIVSIVLFASFLLARYLRTKQLKDFLIPGVALLLLILIFRLAIFGTFEGFGPQLRGMMNLAMDNSSAVAYYPHLPIAVPIAAYFVLRMLWIARLEHGKALLVLFLPGLFAAWKHGIARADVVHVKGFFFFILVVLVTTLLSSSSRIRSQVAGLILAMTCLGLSLPYSYNYAPIEISLFRFDQCADFLFSRNVIEQDGKTLSNERIKVNVLSSSMRDEIGGASVDVYPWDLSVIPANELNWQPRVVLQSYMVYTPWLDEQNAKHFASDRAPEYLLWHLTREGLNVNGTALNSIDGRYLLNDEPITLLEILKHYERVLQDERWLLLKKKPKVSELLTHTLGTSELVWNEWMPVPNSNADLLRAELSFSRSLAQRMLSFLYKDEQFWVLFRSADQRVYKYRIVPKSAACGLWVAPLIHDMGEHVRPTEMMLTASSTKILSDSLVLDWKEFNFATELELEQMFMLGDQDVHSTHLVVGHDFSEDVPSGEVEIRDNGSRKYAELDLLYSPVLEVSLDSIPGGPLRAVFDCWVRVPGYGRDRSISLVLDVVGQESSLIWRACPIDEQAIENSNWMHVQHYVDLENTADALSLKAYVLNEDEMEYELDDMRLQIVAR